MNAFLTVASRLEGLADTALAELYEADLAGKRVARGKIETVKAAVDALYDAATGRDREYVGFAKWHIIGVLDSAKRIVGR